MRKLIAMLMALVMLFGVGAACAEGGEEVLGNVVGGWAVAEDNAITPELQAIFDKALDGLDGVGFTPVLLLGTQVVQGTNYAFLCKATGIYPNALPQWVVVYIWEDLQGNAQVIGEIDDIDLEVDYDHDDD